MIVLDTIVRDNGGAGISMSANASMLLDGARVEHNGGDGVYVSPVDGLGLATIRNSVLSFNGQGGLAAIRAPAPAVTEVSVENSDLSRNGGDGAFAGSIFDGLLMATFTHNSFAHNGLSGISVFGPGTPTFSSSVNVKVTDNAFLNNQTSVVKADGESAQAWSSRNTFQGPQPTFQTDNGADNITYLDNRGLNSSIGSAPKSIGGF